MALTNGSHTLAARSRIFYFPRHQTKEAAEELQPEFRPLPRAKR
jgi:hypothetical protein